MGIIHIKSNSLKRNEVEFLCVAIVSFRFLWLDNKLTMKKKQIEGLINDYFFKINSQLLTVKNTFDEEAIHKWRVAYKKLRAFVRLLNQENSIIERISISKKLKKTYTTLGAIRDLQLQEHRIVNSLPNDFVNIDGYIKSLKKEIKSLIRKLKKQPLKKIIAKCIKCMKASLPDSLSFGTLFYFILLKRLNANAIIASVQTSDNNIHEIRKNLKDIFYIIEWYASLEQNKLDKKETSIKENSPIEQLLLKLGEFHDYCTAIALLNGRILLDIERGELQVLGQIKELWIKEKQSMKESLLLQLKQICL